jgi:hypothetical protein
VHFDRFVRLSAAAGGIPVAVAPAAGAAGGSDHAAA